MQSTQDHYKQVMEAAENSGVYHPIMSKTKFSSEYFKEYI